MLVPTYQIPRLPPPVDFESVRILKALNRAGPAIAYLKGQAEKIPNQGILIDTLTLQEAKASSEIENLVTTQDELFQADALRFRLHDGALMSKYGGFDNMTAQFFVIAADILKFRERGDMHVHILSARP